MLVLSQIRTSITQTWSMPKRLHVAQSIRNAPYTTHNGLWPLSLYSGHVSLILILDLDPFANLCATIDNVAKFGGNRLRISGRQPCDKNLLMDRQTDMNWPRVSTGPLFAFLANNNNAYRPICFTYNVDWNSHQRINIEKCKVNITNMQGYKNQLINMQ